MRYAQIRNGVVVNTVLAAEDFALANGFIACPDDVGIGSGWDGSAFAIFPEPAPVPAAVTRRQGLAVLIKYGIDVQVEAALNAQLAAATSSGNAGLILKAKFALNDWRESQQFERDWPLIGAMQQVFGWTDAYVDSLFTEADSL